jgi:hypothetical protein
MNRRSEYSPAKNDQQDEEKECPAEWFEGIACNRPIRPKAEDQPEKHENPVKKLKAHKV